MHLTPLRALLVEAPLSSGHAFLSAASGLVVTQEWLCVVADDEHCLAVFARGAGVQAACEAGKLIHLIEGTLPQDAGQRKKVKPDFEILLALPGDGGGGGEGAGDERLLALGSGSTAQRMRGAVIDLPGRRGGAAQVRLIDLAPLCAAIAPLVPEVNLEGAVLRGERLLLFNRGNMQFPASQIMAVSLAALLAGGPIRATLCATLDLPQIGGVPLSVTDACALENGHILLSAVAEATADSYADGALVGAAIVELDADFTIITIEPIDPPLKVEGLAARLSDAGVELLCVTDADDPERAAGVYGGVLGAFRP